MVASGTGGLGMSWLYGLFLQHPLIGSILILIGLFAVLVIVVGLCRAAVTLFIDGVAAVRAGTEVATAFVSAATVSLVAGCASMVARLVVFLCWYASRPFVAAWDGLRDAVVTRLDATVAAIGRAREMRRLWRSSGVRTWREFRRQFESGDGPRSEEPDSQAGEPSVEGFAEACLLFGLPASGHFTQAALNAAFRARMQKAHPDRDGTDGRAARLNAARDLIRKHKGWL